MTDPNRGETAWETAWSTTPHGLPWVGQEVGTLLETGRDPLVRLACALAGEPAGAATLLAAARIATTRPRRQDRAEEPEWLARAALVRERLRRRPRRGRTPAANGELDPLPDPELAAVRARLDELAPLPRTVLVLQQIDGLTVADIARATDRSTAAVVRALAEATRAVGASGYQLEPIAAAVPAPSPGEVESARRRLEAGRRRVRTRWLLATAALAGVTTAATVLPGVLRPDPYARPYGAWVYGYEIRPTTGLRVFHRFLTPDADTARLIDEVPGQPAAERRTCDVTATSQQNPAEPPEGRRTHVGTFPARFLPANEVRGPALWWQTAPRLSFETSCAADTSDADLLAVAALVVPVELPVAVPVDLEELPTDEEVRGIYDIDGQVALLVLPSGVTEESTLGAYVGVGTLFGTDARSASRTVRLGQRSVGVEEDEDAVTVCWGMGAGQACVADFTSRDLRPSVRAERLDRLLSIAGRVRVAPDAADRRTWFDARDAVPG